MLKINLGALYLLAILLLRCLDTKAELSPNTAKLTTTTEASSSSPYASTKLLTQGIRHTIKPTTQRSMKRRSPRLQPFTLSTTPKNGIKSNTAILSARQPKVSSSNLIPLRRMKHTPLHNPRHNYNYSDNALQNQQLEHLGKNGQRNGTLMNATFREKSMKNKTLSKTSTDTFKSSRMLTRLVAGHIQNINNNSKFEAPWQTNSKVIKSKTTHKRNPIHFRKIQPVISNRNTTSYFGLNKIDLKPFNQSLSVYEDDEVLIGDEEDNENWDDGILQLSDGFGKELQVNKIKKHKENKKKTLSDQIRDGKYGLIEAELFQHPPKRPGVLSYLPNEETPMDDKYGGLDENDIWLAEDHLLVIKGGTLNADLSSKPWPPIDNFDAPPRPIKIPLNPKVPPPFPVQLQENGPIQFLGNNSFDIKHNDTETKHAGNSGTNMFTRPVTPEYSTLGEQGYIYPAAIPQWLLKNETYGYPFLSNPRSITLPSLGPFPVGNNQKISNRDGLKLNDDDDPAQYYPPAYSFVYKNNFTNIVPPGPLVPGIVLPPPPDQFSLLEADKVSNLKGNTQTRHRIHLNSSRNNDIAIPTSKYSKNSTQMLIVKSPQHQVIFNTSQDIPKAINMPLSTNNISQLFSTSLSTRNTTKPLAIVDPVPVPVAVPIPVYTDNSLRFIRLPKITVFTSTKAPNMDSPSKSYPNINEYLEIKPQNSVSSPKRKSKILSTPLKRKRINKGNINIKYVQSTQLTPLVTESVIYITPKPSLAPTLKSRTLNNFDREVQMLRDALLIYGKQQLSQNIVPRISNVDNIYKYQIYTRKNLDETAEPIQYLQSTSKFVRNKSQVERPKKLSKNAKLSQSHNEEYIRRQNRFKDESGGLEPEERGERYEHYFESSQPKTKANWINSSQLKEQQQEVHNVMHNLNPAPTAIETKAFDASDYYYGPESETVVSDNIPFGENKLDYSGVRIEGHHLQPISDLKHHSPINNFSNNPAVRVNTNFSNRLGITGYANAKARNIAPTPFTQISQFYVSPQQLQVSPRQRQSFPLSIPVQDEVFVKYRKFLVPVNTDSTHITASRPKVQQIQAPHALFQPTTSLPQKTNNFYHALTYQYSTSEGLDSSLYVNNKNNMKNNESQ